MSTDIYIRLLILAQPLESPLTLGKLVIFSEPQFLPLKREVIIIFKEKYHL